MMKNSCVLDIRICLFYPFYHPDKDFRKGLEMPNGNIVYHFKMVQWDVSFICPWNPQRKYPLPVMCCRAGSVWRNSYERPTLNSKWMWGKNQGVKWIMSYPRRLYSIWVSVFTFLQGCIYSSYLVIASKLLITCLLEEKLSEGYL